MKISAVAGCQDITSGMANAMPAEGPRPGSTPMTMP